MYIFIKNEHFNFTAVFEVDVEAVLPELKKNSIKARKNSIYN